MKKFLLLTILGLISQCVPESGEAKFYHYEIVNKSGVDIEIIPYKTDDNNTPDLTKKILIQNGKSFVKEIFVDPPYNNGLDFQRSIYDGYLTKVAFVFNNEKQIIYEYCIENICSDNRNIFHYTHNDEQIEIYTLTIEDFNEAIICNGNCY